MRKPAHVRLLERFWELMDSLPDEWSPEAMEIVLEAMQLIGLVALARAAMLADAGDTEERQRNWRELVDTIRKISTMRYRDLSDYRTTQ